MAELEQGLQRKLSTFREGVTYEGLPAQDGRAIPAQWGIQVPLSSDAAPAGPGGQGAAPGGQAAAAAAVDAATSCSEDQAGTLLRLAAWLALLFAGYGFQRGLCAGGLPYDCSPVNAADVFQALTTLAFTGGALAWLAGITRPERFAWLTARRRCYLWLAYAATLPIYSGLSNIPALHASLASTRSWGTTMVVVLALAGAAMLAALVFHVWLAAHPAGASSGIAAENSDAMPEVLAGAAVAEMPGPGESPFGSYGSGSKARQRRQQRRQPVCMRSLGLYLLPRVALLAYFGAWLIALPASGAFNLHFHHYALGWALACFAAFNHPVSGLALAVGTAIFVQGGAAYGFDPFFQPSNPGGSCLPVSSPPSGQMTCSFWASSAFDLRFCSDTRWIPWFDCNVAWPWPETALATSTSNGSSSGGAGGSATAAALEGGSPAGMPAGAAAVPSAAAAAQPPTSQLQPPGGEPPGLIGG